MEATCIYQITRIHCVINQKPRNLAQLVTFLTFIEEVPILNTSSSWFSSLPPSVSISRQLLPRSSSPTVRYSTRNWATRQEQTHSTHLLLVLTKINLRKTEIVCSVERNLLKEINICESMTAYTRGAAGGKVRTLTSATCGNYSGCWLLQAHDLLHVETRASHESQVVEDGGRSGA